ncbi:hypothetical protein OFS07_10565 [Brachyspira hyodysenteriae]|nr:hypothetical protein [Brachyspira hyodysenteriae]MDA0066643.1 hypothetical protein [Brachyspira hyodysenteriae]MDA0066706.1 hypothetical protein [Brachyspira hyodysenteriae]MDA0071732.1 hypothetical protein [Brachyspira hyodysenteriae]MDA0071787.1 hypothetical protein [Brachyspira hyodysenteriae]MDA0089617.1 hypothetical protein [Brachyspira hyodysenteriae]
MKNLIFALFFWVLFLLAVNALQNDSAKREYQSLRKEQHIMNIRFFS